MFIPHKKSMFNPTKMARIKRTVYAEDEFGCECLYVQITKTRGVKLYPNKSNCDFAYIQQLTCEKRFGRAPKLFSETDIWHYKDHLFYGFITQHVNKCDGVEFSDQVDELNKVSEIMGRSCFDLHIENCGQIGKKVVIVDFGALSSKEDNYDPDFHQYLNLIANGAENQ